MLYAGLGGVGLVLMFFGARYAKREYYLGKPSKIWVPLGLREDISMEEQNYLVEQINGKLRTDAILRTVVIDVGLQEKFAQSTEDAAVKELERRLFVDAGTATTPSGKEVPSINVGVSGTGHESAVLGEASTSLIKHVWIMLGIDPTTGNRIDQKAVPALPGSF
jgi:hypothetical protein